MPKIKDRNVKEQPVEQPQPQPQTTTAVTKREWDGPTAVVPISLPSSGEKVPWLRFYSGNAKNATDVRRALRNIEDGRAYVAIPEDGTTRFEELGDFFLLQAREFYTQMELVGADYKLKAARLTDPGRNSGYDREIVAFCLAIVDGEIVPCVASFRGAKAPAAQQLYAAVLEHKGAWSAVIASLSYKLATSKVKGRPYTIANAEIRSLDAETARLLTDWTNDEDAKLEADRVFETFKAKCREIENKANENV